ncbi:MAG: chemotaxis protein CheW [Deltaproteobacteria bacterium]|nr:chemotaxis protein CheW [Deltaproteobacteria bacterium]
MASRRGETAEWLAPGDPLVQVRCGPWRALVPLRFVERVIEAALPEAAPGAHPLVSIEGDPVPVVFAEALLGAEGVVLRANDQLVALRDGPRRALLWVSAAEDVVPFEPTGREPPGELSAALSSARCTSVLDVPRILEAIGSGPCQTP